MLDQKCKQIISDYEVIQNKLYDSELTSNIKELTKVNRQLNRDQKLYDLSLQYVSAYNENNEARQILETESDIDMVELAKAQLSDSAQKLESLEIELTEEMIPKDPNDDKDCYVEIRPAA
jgi:peptide chain release factor 1